jgi:YegS/Rv2252/BmrU family lipid kinase
MSGTTIIVNLRSQGGKTERRWPALRETLHEVLGPFEVRATLGPGSATELARAALKEGAQLVVALGGDGTINEVVNGFFDDNGPVSSGASFGVVPAGTGGDFVKTLGVAKEARAAAEALLHPSSRAIDVGRLRFTAHDGTPAVRHFVNIASFGISGLVDQYVNRSSKALGGRVSFAWATLRAGLAYKNARVSLSLDGGPPKEGPIYTVAVSNGRYFGGGMMIAPDAALDDGLFDVVTLGDFTLSDLLLRGMDVYSGAHLKNPKVSVARARRVEATAEDGAEVLLDVDGEQPGRLPVRFEVLPRALRVRG